MTLSVRGGCAVAGGAAALAAAVLAGTAPAAQAHPATVHTSHTAAAAAGRSAAPAAGQRGVHPAEASAGRSAAPLAVPSGVTAGVAVFDRQTGTFTQQLNADKQFRSASVVKLLLALDATWNGVPADHTQLDAMLRRSDDDVASALWTQNGGSAIVTRMITRLGLTDTAPPPAGYPGMWGYTALSAADTVRIYRYVLDTAPAPVRDLVMGDLRQSARCGADGFDQRFGIPTVFEQPWAVKQGWSGFGASGGCTDTTAGTRTGARTGSAGARPAAEPADVDIDQVALHTTGTVGPGDRAVVAVFTLQPQGTAFGAAYSNLDDIVRGLDIPGATPRAGSWFGTWGTGVRVRAAATTGSATLTTLPAGVQTPVSCQKQGQEVSIPPYDNTWWAYLPQYGGYVTNIYISSPDNRLPGVPLC